MQNLSIYFLLIVMSIFACEQAAEEQEASSEPEPPTEIIMESSNAPGMAQLSTFTTKSKKDFIVVEKERSSGQRLITIQGTGFPEAQDIITERKADPIEVGQLADLDRDGFEELYIVTRSGDQMARISIIGVASIKDRSYARIEWPEVDPGDPNFQGYKGHERVRFTKTNILRDVPIYKPGDPIDRPSGGFRILTYALEQGENGPALVLKQTSQHN